MVQSCSPGSFLCLAGKPADRNPPSFPISRVQCPRGRNVNQQETQEVGVELEEFRSQKIPREKER